MDIILCTHAFSSVLFRSLHYYRPGFIILTTGRNQPISLGGGRSTVTKQWTSKWLYIANAVFRIVQNHGEKIARPLATSILCEMLELSLG